MQRIILHELERKLVNDLTPSGHVRAILGLYIKVNVMLFDSLVDALKEELED